MDQKNYVAKVNRSGQNPKGEHLCTSNQPFLGPLAAIFELAGSVALQAVSGGPWIR